MKKNIAITVVVSLLIAVGIWWFRPQNKLSTGLDKPTTAKVITPSDTLIEYIDPAGFSFSYPDNLSLTNNLTGETPDPEAYADVELFSKDKSGSLSLRITDTKYATISAWLKANQLETKAPTPKKLGTLDAYEVKTSDRLMLAAIDQGILFTVELPLIEETFWNVVYDKVLADFTFAAPEVADTSGSTAQGNAEEIFFEGEEVVE